MEWIKGTKKHDKWKYCSDCIILDTETSYVNDVCWISSISVIWQDKYYFFRKPSELMDFYNKLAEEYELEKYNRRIVTYIHNAPYDLSYLVGFIKEYLPGRSFSRKTGSHRYYRYSRGNFEWRCSYKLTNLSLDKWAKQLGTKHQKLVGWYDYSKVIYQDTELSEKEIAYDKEDVEVLQECLKKQMEIFGDNTYSIPRTATGYVRRDIRNSCLRSAHYKQFVFDPQILSYEQYRYCLKAFAGGYTHCNRFTRDQIKYGWIVHRDFKSHYPSIMRDEKFPMGKPTVWFDYLTHHGRTVEIPEVLGLWPQYTAVSVICIKHVYLRSDKISMPFLQESKLFMSQRDLDKHTILQEKFLRDNGRILSYQGRRFLIVDNRTLQILWEQYNFEDYFILKVITFKNDYLPDEVLKVVDKYFKDKTDYKKAHKIAIEMFGELNEETLAIGALLGAAKQLLCSIYGCLGTNPIQSMEEDDDFDEDLTLTESNKKKLERYNKSYYSVLPYQWAMMVTAHARYRLYECIKWIGYDKVLYCDTDSLFYLADEETEKNIEAYNKSLRAKAHYVVLKDGSKEYYSSFEKELDCIAFKGLHSKCYGYVNTKNELKLTIAGVPARTCIGIDKDDNPIYLTREQELAGKTKDPIKALDKLNDEFVFKVNTGSTAEYIEMKKPTTIMVNGHEIETCGGCIVKKLPEKKICESHVDEYEINDIDPLFESYQQMIF